MIFRKSKRTVKKSFGTMDKIISGIIITWAAASIFWLSRTKKWKNISQKIWDTLKNTSRKWLRLFWKMSLKFLDIFQKK